MTATDHGDHYVSISSEIELCFMTTLYQSLPYATIVHIAKLFPCSVEEMITHSMTVQHSVSRGRCY